MDKYNLGLLQYDYTDKFTIVLYSSKSTSLQDALNYLAKVKVQFVLSIPEKAFGYYCLLEKDIFKIYNCYTDVESGITLQEYIYSLQYIDVECKEERDKNIVIEKLSI
jgi:hypothetical protein